MNAAPSDSNAPTHVGRYELGKEIGRGGMARVHLGKLVGAVGFARPVAIKTLHPGMANDASFVKMFIDEARLAAQVRHPNVVSVLDVVATDGALYLVMEYVPGATLAKLVAEARAKNTPIPVPIALALAAGTLAGLHAAHEAKGEDGAPLAIVHRDVSPQNVLVDVDGTPKLLDFGVAKAASRMQSTVEGQIKGKLAYMSPEQLVSKPVDRRSDVFSAGIVLWELLTGTKLFRRDEEGATITALLQGDIAAPSTLRAEITPALDAIVLRCLARDPNVRFADAHAALVAIEGLGAIASARSVAEWVAKTIPIEAPVEIGVVGAATGTLPPRAPAAAVAVPTEAPDAATTTIDAPPPHRSRRAWTAIPLGLVALGAIGAFAWPRSSAPSAPVTSAPIETVSASPPPTDPPIATSVTAAPTPPATGAPATTTHRSVGHAKPTGKPAPKPDCRVVNPDGTIGYRPECLR
ncbi:MAG TPA: protein kinase [Polyangiaceae bacterium]